ncbi:MAG: hypothetical protein ACQETG_02320 [Thermodesulfobacteriota bacterium]
MPNGDNQPNQTFQDILIDPLGEILKHVGRAVADAQKDLDRNAIATETELADIREELGYDIHATWYHLPETNIELKLSISMQWEEQQRPGKPSVWKRSLRAAPFNAVYKNLFDYEADGTSQIKAKIVSIPPSGTIERE